MAGITGFDEIADKLREIEDSFSTDKLGGDEARDAISDGITNSLREQVVPEARENVPKDTGRLASSISQEQVGWNGDTYRHKYGSTLDEEYAKVQEFGTNRESYRITPNSSQALRFHWENIPPGMTNPVTFAYVTHPGVDVPQPGPIQKALLDNTNEIQGFVGQEIRERLQDEF